jgi:DNA polymerase I-like protein with 3'-5' exonuclease and polymerase domains
MTTPRQRLFFIDFETYYDTEVSITKINVPPLYIAHPKFHVILMAVGTEVGDVVVHRHDKVKEALLALDLEAEGTVTVCHNAAFDGSILEYHYGIKPWRYADTQAMAQVSGLSLMAGGGKLDLLGKYVHKTFGLLPLKGSAVANMSGVTVSQMDEAMWRLYGQYCADDVKVTRNIYKTTLPFVSKADMRLISETITMVTRPLFTFDAALLGLYSKEVEDELAATLTRLQKVTGQHTNEGVANTLGSDNKLARILRSYGAEPPMKISPAKAKKASTQGTLGGFNAKDSELILAFSKSDQEFLDMIDQHPNPVVRDLCAARLEVKSSLLRTRAKRLLQLANLGITPMPLRFASAHTGRYGGDMGLNVQNLPRGSLRRSLSAKDGCVILAADSSQIEARINAYIANQQDMLDVFRNGEDLYCHMGAALGGLTYKELFHAAKVEPTDHGTFLRKLGKVTELACGYQMGSTKFGDNLELQGIKLPEGMTAEGVVKLYRATKDKISAAWVFNNKVVLERLSKGDVFTFGGPDGTLFKANGADKLFDQPCPTIQLPDGYKLKYYKLTKEVEPKTGYTKFTYVGREDKSGGFATKYIYGGLLQENLCQALAFAVIKWQGIQAITLSKGRVRLGLNVHDEWVTSCKDEDLDVVVPALFDAMTAIPPWLEGCPLACEVDIGLNYQDMETL